MHQSSSQCGEDTWIINNIPLPHRGVFVEVGAADGVTNSNTLAFERLGWDGLLIEPDPRYTQLGEYRVAKVLRNAVTTDIGIFDFPQHDDPQLSGFLRKTDKSEKVVGRRLDDILGIFRIGHVDLLSIDTEGTELDVWRSLGDYDRPSIVIIEWNTEGMPSREDEITATLTADGYDLAQKVGCNLIFTRKAE